MDNIVQEKSLIQKIINQKISNYQWRVILLCFLIALFDGFDTQAVAFTAPALLDHFKLEAGALAPILTAGIVGMTIGAMLLGIVGDRLGRRKTLLICVAIFSISTLLTAFVQHIDQIFVLRIIAGLGMGGQHLYYWHWRQNIHPKNIKAQSQRVCYWHCLQGQCWVDYLLPKFFPLLDGRVFI